MKPLIRQRPGPEVSPEPQDLFSRITGNETAYSGIDPQPLHVRRAKPRLAKQVSLCNPQNVLSLPYYTIYTHDSGVLLLTSLYSIIASHQLSPMHNSAMDRSHIYSIYVRRPSAQRLNYYVWTSHFCKSCGSTTSQRVGSVCSHIISQDT